MPALLPVCSLLQAPTPRCSKRTTDHSDGSGCRSALNIDVARVIGVCETARQMRDAVQALSDSTEPENEKETRVLVFRLTPGGETRRRTFEIVVLEVEFLEGRTGAERRNRPVKEQIRPQ